jgi:hypothetical protein
LGPPLSRNDAFSTLTPGADRRIGKNVRVSITRVAWIATVLVALLTALLLLLAGYTGYAGLGLAVAASAAINLL